MAKILPGAAVAKMSGTIAGTTYQNWRGMLIARSKPTPTNVMTPRQTFIRSLMTLLSRAWRDELTAGLRVAWNQRAKNYPWLDVFGRELRMSGENLYIKQNMVLLDHGLTRVDQPVPDIVPDELVDATVEALPASELVVKIPGKTAGMITAQTPFVKIDVAGGFLSVDDSAVPEELVIQSLALPAGRKHQKADFRLTYYLNDVDVVVDERTLFRVGIPVEQTRNIVVIIQRYNKHGNFSAPRLIEGIRTNPIPPPPPA